MSQVREPTFTQQFRRAGPRALPQAHGGVNFACETPAALPIGLRAVGRRDRIRSGLLALTLEAVGALAALSVRQATKRFAGLHKLAAKMPYASAALMTLIGLLVCIQGARHLLH